MRHGRVGALFPERLLWAERCARPLHRAIPGTAEADRTPTLTSWATEGMLVSLPPALLFSFRVKNQHSPGRVGVRCI